MSNESKKECIASLRLRYLKVPRKERSVILDEIERNRKSICLTLAAASSAPDMNLNIAVAPDFSSLCDLNAKREREKVLNRSITDEFNALII